MGRWRPPPPEASPYITESGFRRLQQELSDLWVKRRDVVAALAAAAAEGDRSENAEYIYRKKELGGIDYRVRYLQKRLPTLKIVREFASGDVVFFGATVELQSGNDECESFRIVGPDEADAGRSDISMDSPLAKALLSRQVGDEVAVDTGGEPRRYRVMSVAYPNRS